MIEKKMFFYWAGDTLSWMRYMTLYSFRKFNPEWGITLFLSANTNKTKTWNGIEEQDFNNYSGKNYLDEVRKLDIKIKKVTLPKQLENISPLHESDLFRYKLLSDEGGFYCDMDVLFFRSMDGFYEKCKEYDTLIYQCPNYIAIGFLGCEKGNEFYKELFNYGLKNYSTSNYQSLGVDLIYSMYSGSRMNPNIIDKIKGRVFNLPTSLVYHYDWTKIEYNWNNRIGINNFDKKSIGYHWFGGSRISQKYNNLMNENNYKEYKTTFTELCNYITKN